MIKPVRKAVFPVGGLGTRFLPATKAMPKEMLPIIDKPMIQYAVEEAIEAGIEEFIFVTGRGKTAIEDHFDRSRELENVLRDRGKVAHLEAALSMIPPSGRICYTRQGDPLGLGHAVLCARELVGDEPFAVLLADDLVLAGTGCIGQMLKAHGEVGGNLVAVEDVPRDRTDRYGVLDPGASRGDLVVARGMVEKPAPPTAPSTLAAVGRYVLDGAIFGYLEQLGRGAGNEIQLTDALVAMIGSHPFHGFRFRGRRFDCGSKIGFLEATIAFALAREDMKDAVGRLLADHRATLRAE